MVLFCFYFLCLKCLRNILYFYLIIIIALTKICWIWHLDLYKSVKKSSCINLQLQLFVTRNIQGVKISQSIKTVGVNVEQEGSNEDRTAGLSNRYAITITISEDGSIYEIAATGNWERSETHTHVIWEFNIKTQLVSKLVSLLF